MTNKFKSVFIVGFLLIIFIPSLGLLLTPNVEAIQYYEKRNPVYWEKPITSDSIEKYFGDRILFKYKMTRIWSVANFFMGVSTKPEQIVLGEDNWLYLGDAHNQVIHQIRGIDKVDKIQIEEEASRARGFYDYLKKKNIAFIFSAAPDKHFIYSEKLPYYLKKSDNPTRLEITSEAMRRNKVPFIDYSEEIISKKNQGYELFYPYDSHWTRMSAFFAYRELMEELKQQIPSLDDSNLDSLTTMTEDGWDDSARVLMVPFLSSRNEYYWPAKASENIKRVQSGQEQAWKANQLFGDVNTTSFENRISFINNDAPNNLTCLVIGDSFTINMTPLYHQSFKKTTYCYNFALKDDQLRQLIEKEKPNIIIVEIVQRSLNYDFPYLY